MGKPGIDELCARYRNEDAHARHVARLALDIFDRLRVPLAIPARDRPLLEAAGLLHDIGYAGSPFDHVAAGARIILKEGVPGRPPEDTACVAAAVLLHAAGAMEYLKDAPMKGVSFSKRALRIAAILRIADGLDHGHIQDAEIVSIRRAGDAIHCIVRSPGYGGNAAWASSKADLWRRCFGIEILLAPEPSRPGDSPFARIVRRDDTVLDGLRRILALETRVIIDNEEGTAAGDNPEHLHDMRVAIRRFRAALRLCARFLKGTRAAALDRRLARLSDRLGLARDADVWLRTLRECGADAGLADDARWPAYLRAQEDHRRQRLRALRRLLAGPGYRALMRQIVYFVRAELPSHARTVSPGPLTDFTAFRIHRLYGRVIRRGRLRRHAPAGQIHRRRKLCRRGRYWAEFSVSLHRPAVAAMALHFKAVADATGDLHDNDVALVRLNDTPRVPERLGRLLALRRRQHWRETDSAWRRLCRKGFQRRLAAALSTTHNTGGKR